MKVDAPTMVAQMMECGLVAIIRVPAVGGAPSADVPALVGLCRALLDGGVRFTEITMTTPGALQAIAEARQALGDQAVLGVGSVLDGATARNAILAGAQFVVSPVTDAQVIRTAHRYGLAVIAGAMTPTEVLQAQTAGADLVKIFPANLLGPQYVKDLLAPMPELRLMPTGGVNLQTVKDWVAAGAACLGVGTALVQKGWVAARNWKALTELAGQYVEAVGAARRTLGQGGFPCRTR